MADKIDRWRAEAKNLLTGGLANIDDVVDIQWRRLRKRLDREGVPVIQPYAGYGNQQQAWLHGRVLENPHSIKAHEDANWWENLADSYRRIASREVPGVNIELDVDGERHRVQSDDEGYFELEVPWQPDVTQPWQQVSARIVDDARVSPVVSQAQLSIRTVNPNADFGIISDVDDTVVHTGATQLLRMAQVTFFGNARTRLPLAGAAKLYQVLQGEGDGNEPAQRNPLFYVSSSPWNLYDLLVDFFEINNLPPGPILLQDYGIDYDKLIAGNHDHKLEKARMLMSRFSDLDFVLFGDSGQDDARLYATLAAEQGSRIRAIFLRDIDPGRDSEHDAKVLSWLAKAEACGVPMYLVANSSEVARHAVELGLIKPDDVARIDAATESDAKRGVFQN